MGHAIAGAIETADDLALAGIWKRGESLAELLGNADVLVDFSLPEATDEVLAAVRKREMPLVCGVSGLDETRMSALKELARAVPVVFDRNMSQGVAVLGDLVRRAAASLGPEFSIEIHETHHVNKLDAPSGTALQLGDSVAEGRGLEPEQADIHYEVERRGDVPGEHAVIFRSATESLNLGHSVTTRDVFAEGALRAARWVRGRPAGFYRMRDVLRGED